MERLRQLIREMHRRSLWQVLGIYLVASAILVRVGERPISEGSGDITMESFDQPALDAFPSPMEGQTLTGGSP